MVTQQLDRWMVFSTALGWTGFTSSAAGVQALTFGHPDRATALAVLTRGIPVRAAEQSVVGDTPLPHDVQELVRDRICRYAAGEAVEFADLPVDLRGCTPFQTQVLQALRKVGFGRVQTYSQLAIAAGFPGAARAVGSVMARNRIPLILPCHRVLREGGQLGGYSAPQGLEMKRRLLELEGLSYSAPLRSLWDCVPNS